MVGPCFFDILNDESSTMQLTLGVMGVIQTPTRRTVHLQVCVCGYPQGCASGQVGKLLPHRVWDVSALCLKVYEAVCSLHALA